MRVKKITFKILYFNNKKRNEYTDEVDNFALSNVTDMLILF